MNDISKSVILKKDGVISRDELIEFLLKHKEAYPDHDVMVCISEDELDTFTDDNEFNYVCQDLGEYCYAGLTSAAVTSEDQNYPDYDDNYNGETDFIQLSFSLKNIYYDEFYKKASSDKITRINHCTGEIIEYF